MLKTAYQRSPKQELAKNTPFFNETDLNTVLLSILKIKNSFITKQSH